MRSVDLMGLPGTCPLNVFSMSTYLLCILRCNCQMNCIRFKGGQPNCGNPAKSCFNASSSVHLYGVLPSTVSASGLPPSCKVVAHDNVLKPCCLSQI
ncbi:hypothetical protein ACLOJK_010468 [Asimina triloba]